MFDATVEVNEPVSPETGGLYRTRTPQGEFYLRMNDKGRLEETIDCVWLTGGLKGRGFISSYRLGKDEKVTGTVTLTFK